jgi:hypothetical protein
MTAARRPRADPAAPRARRARRAAGPQAAALARPGPQEGHREHAVLQSELPAARDEVTRRGPFGRWPAGGGAGAGERLSRVR